MTQKELFWAMWPPSAKITESITHDPYPKITTTVVWTGSIAGNKTLVFERDGDMTEQRIEQCYEDWRTIVMVEAFDGMINRQAKYEEMLSQIGGS